MRSRLIAEGWAGWHGTRNDIPNIWLTEGGVRLNGPQGSVANKINGPINPGNQGDQAERLRRAWARNIGNTGDGAGMEALTQYLVHSDPSYDTGLRNPLSAGGAPRIAYGQWKDLG